MICCSPSLPLTFLRFHWECPKCARAKGYWLWRLLYVQKCVQASSVQLRCWVLICKNDASKCLQGSLSHWFYWWEWACPFQSSIFPASIQDSWNSIPSYHWHSSQSTRTKLAGSYKSVFAQVTRSSAIFLPIYRRFKLQRCCELIVGYAWRQCCKQGAELRICCRWFSRDLWPFIRCCWEIGYCRWCLSLWVCCPSLQVIGRSPYCGRDEPECRNRNSLPFFLMQLTLQH